MHDSVSDLVATWCRYPAGFSCPRVMWQPEGTAESRRSRGWRGLMHRGETSCSGGWRTAVEWTEEGEEHLFHWLIKQVFYQLKCKDVKVKVSLFSQYFEHSILFIFFNMYDYLTFVVLVFSLSYAPQNQGKFTACENLLGSKQVSFWFCNSSQKVITFYFLMKNVIA